MKLFVEEDLSMYGTTEPASGSERSILQVMLNNADQLAPFRFDCGVDDLLIDDNRALHEGLVAHKIDHQYQYQEHPGEHGWPDQINKGIA